MDDTALTRGEMDTLKAAGYLPMGGGVYDDKILVKFAKDGEVIAMTRADWRIIIAELDKPLVEDVAAFGADAWVYCRQHMRAHETGWCSVSPRDKVALGVKTAKEAYDKCHDWGFELYEDIKR